VNVPPGRLPLRGFVVVLAIALLARLACVAIMPREILWPDGREYVAVAHSLLSGHGYGLQTQRPPGYPTFIAGVWAVFGPSLLALRVVEALLGTVSVALIGWLGTRWFGRAAGFIAMTLAACHPVLAFLPSTEYSENLVVFACVAAFGCALDAITPPAGGWRRWAVAGALFGIVTLIRPNAVLLVPGLLAGTMVPLRRSRRSVLAPAIAFVVSMALVVTPWLVRNHRVHGQWFFIATGGGRQLWLGNNDLTTGRAGSIVGPDSTFGAELMRLPDEVARDRRMTATAIDWIRSDPPRAVRMYLIHMSSLWALYPDPQTHRDLINDFARWAQGTCSVIMFAGALLALARARDVPQTIPMAASIVGFSLVSAAFFMVMRYRMPLEPLLIWMAGLGWTRALTGRTHARGAAPVRT